MSVRWSLILLGVFFLGAQTLVLPADGFVTGDQGSKFLQARAFADHGPLEPGIDVRSRDIDPEYHRQEPKLKNRRGRLVSEFLWLLPLLSAPFVRLFGMRGLYLVPAVSALVAFVAAAALGRRMGERSGSWTAWIALAATPVLLYGLELWEHTPAAACVVLAALWLAPDRAVDAAGDGSQSAKWRFAGAGAAIATGWLFREEVVVALPALLLARALARDRDRIVDLVAAGWWTGLGAALVFAASIPVNLMIYGAPLPMHMTQDAWRVAKATPYLQVRREIVVELLLPASHAWLFVTAVAAAALASLFEGRRRVPDSPVLDPTSRTLLGIVHLSIVVALAIAVALPLARLALGARGHDAYRVTSAAHTWTVALALFYWPWVGTAAQRPIARYLVSSAVLLFIGTALLVPTSGGSQWSPRFMLAVAPLLGIAAAVALKPAIPRTAVAVRGGAAGINWMARLVLAASLVMQASGLVWLERGKAEHAQLTHWLAARTMDGDVLITSLFWFPQVTATLAPSRRMLFSWSSVDFPSMAAMADAHGLRRFGIVTSPGTGYDAPEILEVPGGACRYRRAQPIGLDTLGLALNRYGCEDRPSP